MKKIISYLLLITALSFSAKAQDGSDKAFNENSRVLNTGIGAGSGSYAAYRGGGYVYKSSPAFSISYEHALPRKLGPGYLGLGAYLGYQSSTARNNTAYYNGGYYYYQHKWRSFLVGARGAYHFDFINWERAEIYAGVIAGFRVQTYSYDTNNPDPLKDNYRLNQGSVVPAASLFAGARWYFVENIGVFGEVGYGISYATVGFSFKL
ncbi:MAG TPA: hypothetical protein VF868_06795 [Bacteroidia bacterium]